MNSFIEKVVTGDGQVWALDQSFVQNLTTELIGVLLSIIITVGLVDWLRNRSERKRWLKAENKALGTLMHSMTDFLHQNLSTRSGVRRSRERLMKECRSAIEDITLWSNNNYSIFMLGNNRDFELIERLAILAKEPIARLWAISSLRNDIEASAFHEKYGESYSHMLLVVIRAIADVMDKPAMNVSRLEKYEKEIDSLWNSVHEEEPNFADLAITAYSDTEVFSLLDSQM